MGNGDSWAAFPPFQQPRVGLGNPPAGESAEKAFYSGGNGGMTCRGFQHSDRLRVSLGNSAHRNVENLRLSGETMQPQAAKRGTPQRFGEGGGKEGR